MYIHIRIPVSMNIYIYLYTSVYILPRFTCGLHVCPTRIARGSSATYSQEHFAVVKKKAAPDTPSKRFWKCLLPRAGHRVSQNLLIVRRKCWFRKRRTDVPHGANKALVTVFKAVQELGFCWLKVPWVTGSIKGVGSMAWALSGSSFHGPSLLVNGAISTTKGPYCSPRNITVMYRHRLKTAPSLSSQALSKQELSGLKLRISGSSAGHRVH